MSETHDSERAESESDTPRVVGGPKIVLVAAGNAYIGGVVAMLVAWEFEILKTPLSMGEILEATMMTAAIMLCIAVLSVYIGFYINRLRSDSDDAGMAMSADELEGNP